jgi:hypothetical protein
LVPGQYISIAVNQDRAPCAVIAQTLRHGVCAALRAFVGVAPVRYEFSYLHELLFGA